MGTRSYIGKQLDDGTIRAVYCHWDGYPSHNGVLLREHWTSSELVDSLLAEGDMSCLGSTLGLKHDFNSSSPGWCKFYRRDRGESGTESRVHSDLRAFLESADNRACDYAYLFEGGIWRCWPVGGSEIDLNSRSSDHWHSA